MPNKIQGAVERLQQWLDDFDREMAEDIAYEDFNVGQDEFIEVATADLRTLLALHQQQAASTCEGEEAWRVVSDLINAWPDGSLPPGPLCVRAAKIINANQRLAESSVALSAAPSSGIGGEKEEGSSSASLPAHVAPQGSATATEALCDLEEAIRLAEIGEYLYDAKAFVAGDGYHEPREFSINWEWQQHKPNTFGEGALLAEATAWHNEMCETGIETQAARLRRVLNTLSSEAPSPKSEGDDQ